MSTLYLEGPARLEGEIRASGAKNSAVALMAACVLTGSSCVLDNVPDIKDVHVMKAILEATGASVEVLPETGRLRIEAASVEPYVPHELARKLRASSLMLGALIARCGEAKVALPGGCDIGSRPIDLHIKGLEALGARVVVEHGYVIAHAGELRADEIYLDFPSVGATENLMMAATAAVGQTVIYNAAKEPEVVDLANFLNMMGARIKGAGTDIVRIDGDALLSGAEHSIIPDRIEAGTYLIAGIMCRGEVTVEGVIPKHLESLLSKLNESGARTVVGDDRITAGWSGEIRPVNLKTLPYPGFPTDLQPQISAMLMLANGTSIVNERVYDNRFAHVDELKRLGGRIKCDGRTAVISGPSRLTGAPVAATDLRSGAALVIAGLAADGRTEVEGYEHIERGYERMHEKLRALGARIELAADPVVAEA